ncbi:hypothetical protein IV38_GL001921 [Lactobacillus selangorensis]|uniref:Uncharacterized protein n=1 Tax=Lactobacillus selangorensis TaxID=81857 RepID=A0A0R2FRL9_9LACO|nr:hypothetical protein IV38_GL001921 [Lactobacillus selangorensis]KRN30327.1 hypothetical protein IV40_GL001916 [Lactobacillus selangorensis]
MLQDEDSGLSKSRDDFAEIAHETGYQYVDIRRYERGQESYAALGARIDGLTASVMPNDLFVYQYPSEIDAQFEVSFIEHVAYRQTKLVILVRDYHSLHYGYNPGFDEVRLFNLAKALIVPSERMRTKLRADGVNTPIVLQYVGDFRTARNMNQKLSERSVVVLDAAAQTNILTAWQQKTPLIGVGRHEKKLNLPANVNNIQTQSVRESIQKMPLFIGLVLEKNEYAKYRSSYAAAAFLALGMPIIVWEQSALAGFIKINHLGWTLKSVKDVDGLLKSLSDTTIHEYQERVQSFAQLLRNGYFTRQALVAIEKMVTDIGVKKPVERADTIGNMHVLSIPDTCDYLRKHHASIARFGDGEVDIMHGKSIPMQVYDENLAQKLKKLLAYQSDDKLVIGLPDVFGDISKYRKPAHDFWLRRRNDHQQLFAGIDTSGFYGNAFISRPYFDLIDHNQAVHNFDQLKKIWAGRDILIVEGSNTRSGEGNDLFKGAKSIQRIIGPQRDAYGKIAQIEAAIEKYGQHKLILLMLGPTAKAIVGDLALKGYWLVDIGHIDPEYELFKAGATTKIKAPHKHTAEFNYDVEDLLDDPAFNAQVIADFS